MAVLQCPLKEGMANFREVQEDMAVVKPLQALRGANRLALALEMALEATKRNLF